MDDHVATTLIGTRTYMIEGYYQNILLDLSCHVELTCDLLLETPVSHASRGMQVCLNDIKLLGTAMGF